MASIDGGSNSGSDGLEDEVAPARRDVAMVHTPFLPQGRPHEIANVPASVAGSQDVLATIIGPYMA